MLTVPDGKLEIAAFGKHNHPSTSWLQTYPPSLLIIKKETKSEAPMFNLLLCKLFEGWLYGNCSLVLYIYRCTLCQGQGNCVGLILSFQGSISEAICETGQIKLVLTSFLWQGRPTGATFILAWAMMLFEIRRGRKATDMLTNYPKPSFQKATSPNLRDFSSINYWLSALIPSPSLPPTPSPR